MNDGAHSALHLAAALGLSEDEIVSLSSRSKVIVRGVSKALIGGSPSRLLFSLDPAERQRITGATNP